MKKIMLPSSNRILLYAIATFGFFPVLPALAEIREFSQLTLVLGLNKNEAVVMGYTGGSYSLSSIANNDVNGNVCIGFGDPEPDHILILENDIPNLSLKLKSYGNDSTIVIRGPDKQTIRCSFGQNDDRDVSIQAKNWRAGRYEIWIGSMASDRRVDYVLSAQQ